MGDVDVVYHNGLYHLFHLVLPNHDFIAHAVSPDGLNWKRIQNAIFIGHPGSWDDHMLWTMHVTRDPWDKDSWRMFYTGLSSSEEGNVQRVGIARSRDLVHWKKLPSHWIPEVQGCGDEDAAEAPAMIQGGVDQDSPIPISAQSPHYESTLEEGRRWVSFRDPYFVQEGDTGHLVVAARVPHGPVIRRGCVAHYVEVAKDTFEPRPPLHHPGVYDDVEVPNIFKLGKFFYLVGSIREDAKVRYWYSESPTGPWKNFYDNVLLPGGNYAARISFDNDGPMVWNFFANDETRKKANLMPPPKRIRQAKDVQLRIEPFEGFNTRVEEVASAKEVCSIHRMTKDKNASADIDDDGKGMSLQSTSGFEAFFIDGELESFRLTADLTLDGDGKCGFLFRFDQESSSGYHLSLDLLKGVAQLRRWGVNPGGLTEHAFRFFTIQASYWRTFENKSCSVILTVMQNYIEFCIDGKVLLSCADRLYDSGSLGIYVESACLRVDNIKLERIIPPSAPTDNLAAT
ncbi:glycosyl hydrolase [Stratiformator vulcanicus]|nr:glycosyl hydrolase [Stratiformator vulcanicus]